MCVRKKPPRAGCTIFKQFGAPDGKTIDKQFGKICDKVDKIRLMFNFFAENNRKVSDLNWKLVCNRTESTSSACAEFRQFGMILVEVNDLLFDIFDQIGKNMQGFRVFVARKIYRDVTGLQPITSDFSNWFVLKWNIFRLSTKICLQVRENCFLQVQRDNLAYQKSLNMFIGNWRILEKKINLLRERFSFSDALQQKIREQMAVKMHVG